MFAIPELVAVLGALVLAALLSAPGIHRSRRVAHQCRACGRRVVNGVKTCDCELR